jgi:predicted small lipoprotein YifL
MARRRCAGLRRACRLAAVAAALCAAACGKKGPPLAPLYLVPAAVAEVSVRRGADAVRLRFALPATNQNGPGIDLDRVEVYAVTVAPGTEPPANRELLTKPYLVGQIQVRPPAPEAGEEPADSAAAAARAADPRPAPGDVVTFEEPVTAAVLTPLESTPAAVAKAPPRAGAAPAAPAAAGDPDDEPPPVPFQPTGALPDLPAAAPREPVRVYVLQGIARNGRRGGTSARVSVPLGALPEPPVGLAARNTEKAVVVDWLPALASIGGGALRYNVYDRAAPAEPLNPAPLESASLERPGAKPGEELCFQVRTVEAAGAIQLESAASAPACITPKDEFPPAAPRGVAAVATPGAVQLIWDANTDADFAGYLVLRADPPDETLRPLTPAPLAETGFRDATAVPGTRYIYVVVAVDSASPPNRSAPSERVEVVAR